MRSAGTELVRLVQDTHEMELVHTFQPYIIENLDYQAVSRQPRRRGRRSTRTPASTRSTASRA